MSFVMPAPRVFATPARASSISMGSTTDFKVGLTIEFEGAPWKITEFLHVKPGKGPAFVRSKLKNVETGATLDKTWKAGETFPDAQVDKEIMQYSYIDGDDHVFMNMETCECSLANHRRLFTALISERNHASPLVSVELNQPLAPLAPTALGPLSHRSRIALAPLSHRSPTQSRRTGSPPAASTRRCSSKTTCS